MTAVAEPRTGGQQQLADEAWRRFLDAHGELAWSDDPYDPQTTSANFDLDAYWARADPVLMGTSEGRKALCRLDPMLFALTYMRKHLKNSEGEVSFADAHFLWVRAARRWIGPARGQREDRKAFVAPRACGKALALDTPVLTVDRGWVQHGDLKAGDRVFDERGKPCNVVAVSEVWQDRPAYELTFSDGSTIVADENHEWTVTDRYSNRPSLTVDTKTIAARWLLSTARGFREVRYAVPVAGPVEFPERELPIAPYALGAWLGDKHIPDQYLTASITQRMELLRGLMDTDGTIDANGRCEFGVTSESLAAGVLALVRSLGIEATMVVRDAKLNGRVVGKVYRVSFSTSLPVFTLPRKLARIRPVASKASTLRIVGVREVERRATSCISVDSPSHLYLAGTSLVPTHNSTWWFLILPMWAGAFGHAKFAAAFADSGAQAELHLATFKAEQADNALLRADFPDLCNPARRHTGRTVADNQNMLHTRSGFTFVAKGIDSTSLGMKMGADRPDLLIFDDIEPPEATYSPYQRDKRLSTLQNAILPLNELARVVIVGTVTMPGSIIHELVRHQKGEDVEPWIDEQKIRTYHTRPIIARPDGTERSVWPRKWTMEYLESIRHTRSFKLNYDNDPKGRHGDYWSAEDIHYGVPPNLTKFFLFVDPPVTMKTHSDFCGITLVGYAPGVGVSKLTRTDVAQYGRTYLSEALLPSEIVEGEPARLSRVCILDGWAVKLTGAPLRAFLLKLIQQEPRIRTVVLENNQGGSLWNEILHDLPVRLVTYPSRESKEVRFARGLDLCQKRRVTFAKVIPPLEDQLLGFPRIANDDLLDAAVAPMLRLLIPKLAQKDGTLTPR